MKLSSCRDFSTNFCQLLHETAPLSHAITDAAEREMVTMMLFSLDDWFKIAEEIQFITKLELALDDTNQEVVQPIIRPRLTKLFVTATTALDKLSYQIQSDPDSPLIPKANALLAEGGIFVDTLGHEFGNFL